MSKYENYEIIEISREQIKNAEYNPRTIKEDAKKKLKQNIKNVGLISPIIWNERTGNIVGGHQRISIIDSLEKTKDYKIKVAKVNLDEKTEKEQNIFLNNTKAQGEFDFELLQEMYKDGIDFNNAGFADSDIFRIFDDKKEDLNIEHLESLSESIRANDQIRKDKNKVLHKNDRHDFYTVIVFPTPERRKDFQDLLGLEDDIYQNGENLIDLLNQ